jgi:hypothetical protein
MIVLGLVISVFLLLPIGLFGFEVNRMEIARQQLRVACDAASLAAAATLASSDILDPAEAQTKAIETALTTFQQNAVVGTRLSETVIAATGDDVPTANQALIFLEFLDPHNDNSPVSLGDPKGKIIRVNGIFGLEPAFGKFLGLTSVPVRTTSSGGVPMLDVALCFDVSASIDDQTPVTFVRRRWNPTTGRIVYNTASTASGSPAGTLAQGKIFDILGPPPTGSSVDGIFPQHLSSTNSSQSTYDLYFSEVSGASGSAVGLRGTTNAGSPPGNCPPGKAGIGNSRTFTDLVVNIDGKNQFAGLTTSDGYSFPDTATLVEAARGNLENNTVFSNSKAGTGLPVNIQPRAGYQATYFKLASANEHPLQDAKDASEVFFTIMNTNTDAHFSLVGFSNTAGTSATSYDTEYNVDSSYTKAGQINCPVPLITLDATKGVTKFDEVVAAMAPTVPVSGTNIGDAVNTAVNQLKTRSRSGAKKAIVVFTDGQPTSGGPLNDDPWTNARKAAVNAKNAGIAIYTIGLAQTPAIIPGETAILNDTNPNQSTGGIAAIAGNGGKFFLVTRVEDLRLTFENIARQLVQLVK